MKIPAENTPELAQWYLERGQDERTFAWGVFVALLVCLPPVGLIWLPFAICKARNGKKKIQIGEEMNAQAGRPNVRRQWSAPQGVVPQFTSRPEPSYNARFHTAALHPPH